MVCYGPILVKFYYHVLLCKLVVNKIIYSFEMKYGSKTEFDAIEIISFTKQYGFYL
ncbi:hypothetical protein ES332_A09G201800v1 [Gossypium tomentosum]|uniref:Uncharacterized protein n=1 Tax=Gossypium tomentosum TaxID=34277 RepID=A0A5D2P7B9_GOSTO|nr:hypothetical protein ES332_A09G201800v1 [Gossypium tomentosum]